MADDTPNRYASLIGDPAQDSNAISEKEACLINGFGKHFDLPLTHFKGSPQEFQIGDSKHAALSLGRGNDSGIHIYDTQNRSMRYATEYSADGVSVLDMKKPGADGAGYARLSKTEEAFGKIAAVLTECTKPPEEDLAVAVVVSQTRAAQAVNRDFVEPVKTLGKKVSEHFQKLFGGRP